MAYDQELASRVRTAIAGQSDVDEKKMFGGLSFMVGGQMCCGVLKNDLVVRVGEARFEEAMADPHARPFDFTGRPSAGMVYVAADGLTSDQALAAWVQRGVEYVTAHPRPATQKGKKRARA